MKELFGFSIVSFALLTGYLFLHWVMPVEIEVYLELPVEWTIQGVKYLWVELKHTVIYRHSVLSLLWITSAFIALFGLLVVNDV